MTLYLHKEKKIKMVRHTGNDNKENGNRPSHNLQHLREEEERTRRELEMWLERNRRLQEALARDAAAKAAKEKK